MAAHGAGGQSAAAHRGPLNQFCSQRVKEHCSLRGRLRVLGHVEGKTANIDYRYVDGDVARLKPLVQELVALKPDVVLASAPSPVIAVKSVAPNLPVVCPTITDVLVPDLRRAMRTRAAP